jgi:hypothetical protein
MIALKWEAGALERLAGGKPTESKQWVSVGGDAHPLLRGIAAVAVNRAVLQL